MRLLIPQAFKNRNLHALNSHEMIGLVAYKDFPLISSSLTLKYKLCWKQRFRIFIEHWLLGSFFCQLTLCAWENLNDWLMDLNAKTIIGVVHYTAPTFSGSRCSSHSLNFFASVLDSTEAENQQELISNFIKLLSSMSGFWRLFLAIWILQWEFALTLRSSCVICHMIWARRTILPSQNS